MHEFENVTIDNCTFEPGIRVKDSGVQRFDVFWPSVIKFQDADGSIKELDLAAVWRLVNEPIQLQALAYDVTGVIERRRQDGANKQSL